MTQKQIIAQTADLAEADRARNYLNISLALQMKRARDAQGEAQTLYYVKTGNYASGLTKRTSPP